jgi:hypothetical protein
VAISFLTLESVSTPLRARSKFHVAFVQVLLDVLHGFQADRCIRARQSEARQRRLQDAAQMVVRDDFGKVIRRGGAGGLSG